jgi:hypothetical protein
MLIGIGRVFTQQKKIKARRRSSDQVSAWRVHKRKVLKADVNDKCIFLHDLQ